MNKRYCAAKWEELYLYLNHGSSNSCHHPIPHNIPVDEIAKNPAALHNTSHKLQVQTEMSRGIAVDECHMCWHIEDHNPNAISDRMQKNKRWDSWNLTPDPNHVPRFVEVVFDNLCNLNCSYCDSGSSSTWASEITKNPLLLQTDYRNLYSKVHIKPGTTRQEYLDAWNKWWPDIKDKIEVLKISGGEPLTSPNFWKTIDSIDEYLDVNFNLNSNMSVDLKYLQKLASYASKFKTIKIAASIDATDSIAEFTRANLDYNKFIENVKWWLENTPDNCILNFQSTFNIFSIWGLMDMVEMYIDLKNQYPEKFSFAYSTVVRYPEFQSVLLLPSELRTQLHQTLQSRFNKVSDCLLDNERNYLQKSINYLLNDISNLTNLDTQKLKHDLVKFTNHYETIANKKIQDIYPTDFVNWLSA
jgi:organic radical activating enzyme